MPELMSSLPVAGVDGTLSRSKGTPGRAHLKTGSLRDVVGIAGYVLADSGRRYVVVAIVNHANANARTAGARRDRRVGGERRAGAVSGSFARAALIAAPQNELLCARVIALLPRMFCPVSLRWRKSAQR